MFTNFNIPTPALLIDKTKVEMNIEKLKLLTESKGIKHRPHIKTHKSVRLAKMQIEAGAVGIACAKLGEAEVFADAGIKDIQIAHLVIGDDKIRRLIELHDKTRALSCCVDSEKGARALAEAFSEAGRTLDVFIKIDVGFNRIGISDYEEILEMAQLINSLEGLRLKGILTHAGQAYAATDPKEVRIAGLHEGVFMSELYEYLTGKGIEIEEVSVGSTPTAEYCIEGDHVTELRAGNYILYDMIQVALGSCSMDECALSVLATVQSTPAPDRAVIDAGSKALGLDKGAHSTELLKGYGFINGKNGEIRRVSEEHGIIIHDKEDYSIGEKLRITPNHACAVMNLYDHAYLIEGEEVVEKIKIDARGRLV